MFIKNMKYFQINRVNGAFIHTFNVKKMDNFKT